MIRFSCGSCQKKLTVRDELAGKKVKCPGCERLLPVPEAAATATAPAKVRSHHEEKTLPPGAAVGAEVRTLPPRDSGQAGQDSHSEAGNQTAMGAAKKADATQLVPANGPGAELWGFLAPAQQADEIGRLGPYRVLKVLGAGGMGVVFKAEDPGLQRLVALKAMLPALASSASAKERFFREARAAAALKHPHIVTIFQVGEDRGAPFLAMEFLEGEPLDDRLKRDKKLPIAEVLRIGREVAEGLACAHDKGLMHRDIKPANIWLETSASLSARGKGAGAAGGHVKILDFGLARAMGEQTHMTQSGTIIGTPAYMAPEQAGGRDMDHRCDLFSLGCVLYRLCTGEMPFKGNDTIAILSALALETPPPPLTRNSKVPEALSDLVMRLMAKKPQDRPASAHDVAQLLQKIAAQLDSSATRTEARTRKEKEDETRPVAAPSRKGGKKVPSPPARSPSRAGSGRRWVMLAASGVLGLGLLALVLFFLLQGGKKETENAGVLPESNPAEGKQPAGLPATFTNALGMQFVLVPKGKSWLGGTNGKQGDKEVTIPTDFYLGKYEVTQEEWEKVMDKNPSHFQPGVKVSKKREDINFLAGMTKDDVKRFPVEQVSFQDAQDFVTRLNDREKQAGWSYRLPTEVEWEYACRGGPMADKSESAFDFYFDVPKSSMSLEMGNCFASNSLRRTCKVGSYPPNRLGLHDMHGNVWECCTVGNGERESQRVVRGGCWNVNSNQSRAGSRLVPMAGRVTGSTSGLRVARVAVSKEGK